MDQRAAARSAKVIRRYVPSAAPERIAPPPEDPAPMQAWLGRVIPVPAPAQSASSKAAAKRQNKAADKRRRKTDHVKTVKGGRTLDQWLKGTRSAGTATGQPPQASIYAGIFNFNQGTSGGGEVGKREKEGARPGSVRSDLRPGPSPDQSSGVREAPARERKTGGTAAARPGAIPRLRIRRHR